MSTAAGIFSGSVLQSPSFFSTFSSSSSTSSASPASMGRGSADSQAPASSQSQMQPEIQKALDDLRKQLESVTPEQRTTYEVMHGGNPDVTLLRFLKAREYDPVKAHKMLLDCLDWRVKNDIDNILERPLLGEKHEKIRASQLYGMTGFDHEGRPVMCVRVGLSFMDPSCKLEEYVHSHIQHNEYRDRVLLPEASQRKGAPVTSSVKIYDMSGLKLTQLGRMQMHRAVAAIDDLNYPEKSEVYYVVNAPSVFSTCWKAVKPLLQERTRKKVRVLTGNGKEELLQEMDEKVLPHFVKYAGPEGLGSSKNLQALATNPSEDPSLDCCSTAHPYHAAMQEYMLALRQKAKALGMHRNMSHREVPVEGSSEKKGEETDINTVLEEALQKVAISEQQEQQRAV